MVLVELDSLVEKFMRRTLYFLDGEESAAEASKIMRSHGVGSVLVTKKGGLAGIVTERDLLNKVLGEGLDAAKVKLRSIMSSPVVTVDAKAKVCDALKLMASHGFRRLVVTQGEKAVGLIDQRFTVKEEIQELLGRAYQPAKDAMKLHPFYRGKIEVILKAPVRSYGDFAIWYTPGVAEPCKAIFNDKSLVYEYTNKWNSVAVVTDGTRVLGLGDIGPEAGLPVMEGKALLFKYLGGVDAFPLCLASKDPEDIIRTVKLLQPSFGGVNLEDIAQPKCFDILETLRKEAEIPVWHDDQQGTATVVLAGALNALKVVGKKKENVVVALIGAGAANLRIAWLLIASGFHPGHLILVDSKGILNTEREDLMVKYPQKWELALKTNSEGRAGGIPEALKGADVVIAMSKPGPGTIQPEWIASMARDSVVFACANPIPEIWPWEAQEAGAKVVATGRSDFPNQVNNSLGFPGIFRGTLDVRAKTITDRMCLAAADELARVAEDQGLNEEYILPTMEQSEVYWREAVAVGVKAQAEGIALRKISRDQLLEEAKAIITRAREMVASNTNLGFIKSPPPDEGLTLGA